ncbi:unnamed protein product [Lymnaea stagnalis]|uniref:Roc domain-containing protein n=1 Tax=Lymnaea stagnalis TaxID=6523 RepID=A0AAV2HDQ3_LYMST
MTTHPKRRQRIAVPYDGPYGLGPVSHVGYQGARHLQPERLPSDGREDVVAIRIIDLSSETLANVKVISSTIKRLVAANLHLRVVPEDLLLNLVHLTKLDLSNNELGDNSLPDSLKSLTQLLEIRLSNNRLTKLPVCVRKLKNLTRLDLSDNQIESAAGLDKLRKLQILVYELTSLIKEISALKRLEILRCSGNKIREIPRDIRMLRSLVDLDLSANQISALPTDIFLLPNIDVLNVSQNEVTKVPTYKVRHQDRRWISSVDLSDNKLTTFPGQLLLTSSKLDISGNRIKTLPYNAIKKLDADIGQQLLMDDNPVAYPPADVCFSGLKNIIAFFQESLSEVKVYQGVKVLVVGPHQSGKTSMVQTLVDQQTRMAEDTQDTSAGIDTFSVTFDLDELEDGKPGKSLEMNIWDFCGHPFYMYPHYVFFEHPTITLLTFNMAEFSPAVFGQQLGRWVDWMIAKTNHVVVILVGTQSDLIGQDRLSQVTTEVREEMASHIDRIKGVIRSRIAAIEERPHISPTLSEQLKAYRKLEQQAKFTIYPEVISTSSKKNQGFDRLRQAIESLSEDKSLFPNVMRVVPTFWLDVHQYIEDRGNAMVIPVLKFETFEEEVTSRFGMKHLVKSIAEYLHETGQILWFQRVESLKGIVCIRPSWLFDVFRLLLRHDFEHASQGQVESSRSLTNVKFERLKKETMSDGVLDRDLVRSILAPLLPFEQPSLATEVMLLLTDGFELGYSIIKRQRDSVYSLLSDRDTEGKVNLSKVLVPWLRRNGEPSEFTHAWESIEDHQRVGAYFKFPNYFPPGLFEIVCVRSHGEKHRLRFLHHWGAGVHAMHLQEAVHVLMTYYDQFVEDAPGSKFTMFKFEVRDDKWDLGERTPISTMWSILLPLLLDLEDLLGTYAGLLVERLTECPLCRQPTFLGEWLTPKETQAMLTRTCDGCQMDVDTAFLVQPREKKRVFIKRKDPSLPQISTHRNTEARSTAPQTTSLILPSIIEE